MTAKQWLRLRSVLLLWALLSVLGFIAQASSAYDGHCTVATKSGADLWRGGTYLLRDPVTGQVMRTGRTGDLVRREAEHARDAVLGDFKCEAVHRTDVYSQQRGLEQLLHETYNPALDKINRISPTNPNRQTYLDAARHSLQKGNP